MRGTYFNIVDDLLQHKSIQEKYSTQLINLDSSNQLGKAMFIAPKKTVSQIKPEEYIDTDKAFTLRDVLSYTGKDISLESFNSPSLEDADEKKVLHDMEVILDVSAGETGQPFSRLVEPTFTGKNLLVYEQRIENDTYMSLLGPIVIPMQVISVQKQDIYRIIFLEHENQLNWLHSDFLRNIDEEGSVVGFRVNTYLNSLTLGQSSKGYGHRAHYNIMEKEDRLSLEDEIRGIDEIYTHHKKNPERVDKERHVFLALLDSKEEFLNKFLYYHNMYPTAKDWRKRF